MPHPDGGAATGVEAPRWYRERFEICVRVDIE